MEYSGHAKQQKQNPVDRASLFPDAQVDSSVLAQPFLIAKYR